MDMHKFTGMKRESWPVQYMSLKRAFFPKQSRTPCPWVSSVEYAMYKCSALANDRPMELQRISSSFAEPERCSLTPYICI